MHILEFIKDYPIRKGGKEKVYKKGDKYSATTAEKVELVGAKKVAKVHKPKVKQVQPASTSQPIITDKELKAAQAEAAKYKEQLGDSLLKGQSAEQNSNAIIEAQDKEIAELKAELLKFKSKKK